MSEEKAPLVRRDFMGSRIIRTADLTAFAEAEVTRRMAEQDERILTLEQENQALRGRIAELRDDERLRRFATAVHDLIERYEDGDEFPADTPEEGRRDE